MRQVGIIAAGALYAMQNHRERLTEDHANAQIFADAVRATEGIQLLSCEVDTNIVFIDVDPSLGTAADFVASLQQAGILTLALAPTRVRAVTHLDVDESDMRRVAKVIPQVAERLASGIRADVHDVETY